MIEIYYSPVLLSGETGVGKHVIAKAIDLSSRRRDGRFSFARCSRWAGWQSETFSAGRDGRGCVAAPVHSACGAIRDRPLRV